MARYKAIFDEKGKAYEYTNGELTWIRPDLADAGIVCSQRTAAVLGDIPDFVSPIDGSIVSGRAGMRDHCARHNVVPTAELAGLPPKTLNQQYAPSQREREATKRTIAAIIDSRYH